MQCEVYTAHQLGDIENSEFERHSAGCAACQHLLAEDAVLMQAAAKLADVEPAPLLWAKIENSLRQAQQAAPRAGKEPAWKVWSRIAIAAGMAFLVGLGIYRELQQNPEWLWRDALLSERAVARADAAEKEYIAAIRELEKKTAVTLDTMHIELRLLYKDKLAMIDAQIAECRAALQDNPANTHVRKFMLAALREKKSTLAGLTTGAYAIADR